MSLVTQAASPLTAQTAADTVSIVRAAASPQAVAAMYAAIAALVVALITAAGTAASAIYGTRRSAPFSRNRLLADVEILERAKALGVPEDRITAWMDQELSNVYDRYKR